jgi:MFS family permease
MNMEIGTERKPRLFYGWWIVLAGFFVVAYGTGATGYVTRTDFLFKELGSVASKTAIALTIFSGGMAIASLATGPLIDKFGPRKLMLVGIPVASIALLGLGFANSPLYILLGVFAIGISAGFLLPVQTATANWFMKKRSIALAIICAAPALVGPIAKLIEDQITSQFGSQSTLLGLGIVMLVIGIPLALVIRHKPEQHGHVPDGGMPIFKETVQFEKKDSPLVEVNYSLGQAIRTKTFWILVIAISLIGGFRILINIHSMIYLLEQGFDRKITGNFSELTALMGLAGILLFGFLGDKFPKRYLLAIAVAIQSLSIVILMTAGSIPQLYLYMFISGFGSGTVPLILAIRADYFGRKSFATITVVMGFISGILSVGFPSFGGWVLDTTGSNPIIFLLSMLIGFTAAVMFFLAKPPESPQKVSAEIES